VAVNSTNARKVRRPLIVISTPDDVHDQWRFRFKHIILVCDIQLKMN
jgi:hypothetical protein